MVVVGESVDVFGGWVQFFILLLKCVFHRFEFTHITLNLIPFLWIVMFFMPDCLETFYYFRKDFLYKLRGFSILHTNREDFFSKFYPKGKCWIWNFRKIRETFLGDLRFFFVTVSKPWWRVVQDELFFQWMWLVGRIMFLMFERKMVYCKHSSVM